MEKKSDDLPPVDEGGATLSGEGSVVGGSLRCTNCGVQVSSVLRKMSGADVVDTCQRCNKVLDPYCEHDEVSTCIAVALLRGPAWSHVVFNSSRAAVHAIVITAIFAVLVDMFTIAALTVFKDERYPLTTVKDVLSPAGLAAWRSGDHPPLRHVVETLVQPLTALRVVNLVHNGAFMPFADAAWDLLPMFLGSLLEQGLSFIALLWLTAALSPAGRAPPQRCVLIAFALTCCVRLGCCIHYVWDAPLYFMLLTDAASLMWTFKALGTLTGASVLPRAFGSGFCYTLTRVVVRGMVGWCAVLPYLAVVVQHPEDAHIQQQQPHA